MTRRRKPKENDNDGGQNPSASLLELDPSAWMFSYGVDDGVVTQVLREKVRVLSTIIPVTLDPNETIRNFGRNGMLRFAER